MLTPCVFAKLGKCASNKGDQDGDPLCPYCRRYDPPVIMAIAQDGAKANPPLLSKDEPEQVERKLEYVKNGRWAKTCNSNKYRCVCMDTNYSGSEWLAKFVPKELECDGVDEPNMACKNCWKGLEDIPDICKWFLPGRRTLGRFPCVLKCDKYDLKTWARDLRTATSQIAAKPCEVVSDPLEICHSCWKLAESRNGKDLFDVKTRMLKSKYR